MFPLQVAWSWRDRDSQYVSIPEQGEPHAISFQDHNLNIVKSELASPAVEVVQLALAMLIGSTQKANQAILARESEATTAKHNEKGRLAQLIKVACQALVREGDNRSIALESEHEKSALDYRLKRAVQHNTLAPINQIPVEIISNILVMSLSNHFNGCVSRLRQLASVARSWRDVVIATPRLWVDLSGHMSTTQLEWAAKKSKGSLVDVTFGGYRCIARAQFAEVVIPLASRWRTLYIDSMVPEVLSCLELQTAVLEEVNIQGRLNRVLEYPRLCAGVRLRSVKLFYATLPWNSNRLSRLRVLHIIGLAGQLGPTIENLIGYLEDSPDLESVVLDGLNIGLADGGKDFDRPPLSLPALRRLELTDIPYPAYQAILSRISAPNCSRLALDPLPPGGSLARLSDFDHASTRFLESASCSLRSTCDVTVTAGQRTITMKSQSFDPTSRSQDQGYWIRLRIDSEPGECSRLMDQLSQLLQLASPQVPVAFVILSSIHDGFEPRCLRNFHSMRSIKIPTAVGFEVLQFLGEGRTNELGEEEWPCPDLESIDLLELKGVAVGTIRRWAKGRWEKYKETDEPPPDGLVDVMVPIGKAGKAEQWRPVTRSLRRK